MLRLVRSRCGTAAIGLHFERFDIAQTTRALETAYRSGVLEPGLDSVIVHDPLLQTDHVSVGDLSDLIATVLKLERGGARGVPYTSVLVSATPAHQRVLRVFTDVARATVGDLGTHRLVRSIGEAEDLLALQDIPGQLADLAGADNPGVAARLASRSGPSLPH